MGSIEKEHIRQSAPLTAVKELTFVDRRRFSVLRKKQNTFEASPNEVIPKSLP
jgi:hypothetical protein